MAVIPSPLSNSLAGINQSTVSGNIFGGGNKVDAQTESAINANTSAVASLQKQVNELSQTNAKILSNLTQIGSFQAQVDSVRLQLNGISDTLQSVATITATESALEKQKDLYEQEQQKRLAEAGARGGKESLLETKIQSALSEPVKRIGDKVSFGFNNLMSFVWTLLGGWLTVQGIETLKALQDDNKKKLNDIKNSVIRTLLVAGGVFTIISVGIGKVIGTITGLVGKIGKFIVGGLIIKPFQLVATALRGALPGRTVTPPSQGTKGPKPGGGGKFGGVGRFVTFLSGLMNFKNKEYTDGILAALSLASRAPGPLGAIGKIAGIAFTADEITEAFGKNIFTDSGLNKKVDEIAKNFTEANKTNKLESSPIKKSEPPKPADAKLEPPKPADAKSTPSTPMIPPASNLQINAPDTSKPATSAPSPEMVSKFEQAWQYKDNSLARGRIEGAWNNMSSDEKQQAKDWAISKGYDWKEMKLPDSANQTSSITPKEPINPATTSATPTPPVTTTTAAETSSKPSTPEITPAQTTKIQTLPFNIGPEPEPKPNIVYASSGSSTPPQEQPMSIGAVSDVPVIPSSNSDNFYTLYSQINYNVVL
jgi:hypothetical protein